MTFPFMSYYPSCPWPNPSKILLISDQNTSIQLSANVSLDLVGFVYTYHICYNIAVSMIFPDNFPCLDVHNT